MRCKALFVAMTVCLLSGCTSVAYLNDEVKANPDRSATLIMSTRVGSAYMPTLYYYGMVSEIDGENVFRKADQYKVSPGHHYVTMYCAPSGSGSVKIEKGYTLEAGKTYEVTCSCGTQLLPNRMYAYGNCRDANLR